MARIDALATYFGAVGLVVGGIGLALGFDGATPPTTFTNAEAAVSERADPRLAAEPVAFYDQTLELIAPPRRMNEPAASSEEPTGQIQTSGAREVLLKRTPERPASTTRVIVNRRNEGVQVYRVEREVRR